MRRRSHPSTVQKRQRGEQRIEPHVETAHQFLQFEPPTSLLGRIGVGEDLPEEGASRREDAAVDGDLSAGAGDDAGVAAETEVGGLEGGVEVVGKKVKGCRGGS